MNGMISESESFYRAALKEAEKHGDPQLLKDIELEFADVRTLKSAQAEKLQFDKEPDSERTWLWQSHVGDCARVARNRKYTKQWMPIFKITFQKEQALSGNDPARLIELGDLQMELLNLPYAEVLYRQASVAAQREKSDALELQVLNRLAHVAYSKQNYSEAVQNLDSALSLAEKIQSKTVIPILVAHKAQVYAESDQPAKGVELCRQALAMNEGDLEPELKWYINLLLGHCLSLSGDHDQAISILRKCEQNLDIFPKESQAKEQLCTAIAEASIESGHRKDADSYFYKLVDSREPDPQRTIFEYEHKFLNEAEYYRNVKKHKQDLFLCDLVLRTREGRVGKNHPGLVRILTIQRDACRAAGEFGKARETQSRIDSITHAVGSPGSKT